MIQLNFIKTLREIFITLVVILVLGCKDSSIENKQTYLSMNKTKDTLPDKKISRMLVNGNYSIGANTTYSNDTLDIPDWKENIYSSPIIKYQNLDFFENDKLIKNHILPINLVKRKTIKDKIIEVVSIPIYEVCLLKGKEADFYLVNGADYCNGSKCPEFIGIYTMNGDIIYEGISTIGALSKKYLSLKTISEKFGININSPFIVKKTDEFWNQ
jgi:hypothetical protein